VSEFVTDKILHPYGLPHNNIYSEYSTGSAEVPNSFALTV